MKMNLVISILVVLAPCSLFKIDPSFEVPVLELCPEIQDILLESILSPQFSGLEIAHDILPIDLVDGQFAQKGPGLGQGLLSEALVYAEESVGLQFGVINHVFVSFVEYEMQDAFGLELAARVGFPDLECGLLLWAIFGVEIRDDDEFLEGVVEMLLKVVEGRIFGLFYFLLLLAGGFLSRFLYNFRRWEALIPFLEIFLSIGLDGTFKNQVFEYFFYLKAGSLANIIFIQSGLIHEYFDLILVPIRLAIVEVVLLVGEEGEFLVQAHELMRQLNIIIWNKGSKPRFNHCPLQVPFKELFQGIRNGSLTCRWFFLVLCEIQLYFGGLSSQKFVQKNRSPCIRNRTSVTLRSPLLFFDVLSEYLQENIQMVPVENARTFSGTQKQNISEPKIHFSNLTHAYPDCPVSLQAKLCSHRLLPVLNCVVWFDYHILTIVISEIISEKRSLNRFSGKTAEGREG